jgi:hypothetical protein
MDVRRCNCEACAMVGLVNERIHKSYPTDGRHSILHMFARVHQGKSEGSERRAKLVRQAMVTYILILLLSTIRFTVHHLPSKKILSLGHDLRIHRHWSLLPRQVFSNRRRYGRYLRDLGLFDYSPSIPKSLSWLPDWLEHIVRRKR